MDTQKTTEFAVACDVKREKVRVIPIVMKISPKTSGVR